MRQKYEVEAVAKGEELEMTKMKLTARNTEAEATIDNLNAKLTQIGKAKGKIQGEINEMTVSLDRAQVINATMERKAKAFDKTISEMKGKIQGEINEMTVSLDQAQVINATMERKAKAFDKTISEMKGKVDRLSYELDVSQKDTRNVSSE